MKVLLWMPEGDVSGGHRTQLDQTAAALRSMGLGVSVVTNDETPELIDVDIVHGFGLSTEQIRLCRTARIPVALSTIWWSRDYTAGLTKDLWHPKAVWSRAKFGVSMAMAAVRGHHIDKAWNWVERWQRARVQFEMADVLLPNSQLEAKAIYDDLKVTTPTHVVPNAVDPNEFLHVEQNSQHERTGALFVGRVEPHKNQLGAIRAMRGSSVCLTVRGYEHPHHPGYAGKCRMAAKGNVTFHDPIPAGELVDTYRGHKVHVLPSWFETTGLVSLEAALCGCNIVTTDRGFAREYFGDLAWYCDPAKPKSIREAVETAHASPFQEQLRQRVLERYTWRHTAEATLAAYRILLRLPQSESAVVG